MLTRYMPVFVLYFDSSQEMLSCQMCSPKCKISHHYRRIITVGGGRQRAKRDDDVLAAVCRHTQPVAEHVGVPADGWARGTLWP